MYDYTHIIEPTREIITIARGAAPPGLDNMGNEDQ
jgi:hypothetical protein